MGYPIYYHPFGLLTFTTQENICLQLTAKYNSFKILVKVHLVKVQIFLMNRVGLFLFVDGHLSIRKFYFVGLVFLGSGHKINYPSFCPFRLQSYGQMDKLIFLRA